MNPYTAFKMSLGVRAQGLIAKAGIDTLAKAEKTSRLELLAFQGAGKKTVDEIESKLKFYGKKLKEDGQ